MARPLRIEYPGAVYHITFRGNARMPIFDDDQDRERFLSVLEDNKAGVRSCFLSLKVLVSFYG